MQQAKQMTDTMRAHSGWNRAVALYSPTHSDDDRQERGSRVDESYSSMRSGECVLLCACYAPAQAGRNGRMAVTAVSVVNGVSSMSDDAPSIDFAPHAARAPTARQYTSRIYALYSITTLTKRTSVVIYTSKQTSENLQSVINITRIVTRARLLHNISMIVVFTMVIM